MDNMALLQATVGYEADTGLFYWKEFTADDLIELGMTSEQAGQVMSGGKFPMHQDIVPVPVDAKGDKYTLRFTMAGNKVRVHTAVAAWYLATGAMPEHVMLHVNGNPQDNTADNLLHASTQAAKLLVRNYEGITVRGNDIGFNEYQALVRFYEDGKRRSRSGPWRDNEADAVKDRKELLIENGLWYVARLSAVIKELTEQA